jgi:hypothetical protein
MRRSVRSDGVRAGGVLSRGSVSIAVARIRQIWRVVPAPIGTYLESL